MNGDHNAHTRRSAQSDAQEREKATLQALSDSLQKVLGPLGANGEVNVAQTLKACVRVSYAAQWCCVRLPYPVRYFSYRNVRALAKCMDRQ